MPEHAAEGPVPVLLVDPGGELGGAEMVLDTIARRADRSRFRPVVACLGEGSWPESLAHDGIPVEVIPRGRLRQFGTVLMVLRSLVRCIRRERIEVVHASLASSVLYAAVAGRWCGVRVIWHLHDPQGTQGFRRRLFLRVLLRMGADHIIFGNPAAESSWREILAGRHIPASTILPGVDGERIVGGDAGEARAQLDLPAGVPIVSMFARAVHYKGHEDLVRAAAIVKRRIPTCRFVICTAWNDESGLVDDLRGLVRDLGLEGSVLLPGGVPEEVKFGLLCASQVIAHPSWFEPYGLAILEGMAAGKPVVAARSEGASFLIDDGVSGLVVSPKEPERLAEALLELLEDRDRCETMGSAARERAAAFTNQAMVAAVQDVWDSVSQREDAPPGDPGTPSS